MNIREMINLYSFLNKEEEIVEIPKFSDKGIEICIILDTSPGQIELDLNRKIFSSIESFLNEQKMFKDDSCFLFITTNDYEIIKHCKQEISGIKEIKKGFHIPASGAMFMDSLEKALEVCNNKNSVIIIISHSDKDYSPDKEKEKEIINKIKNSQKRNEMMFVFIHDGKMCQKWLKKIGINDKNIINYEDTANGFRDAMKCCSLLCSIYRNRTLSKTQCV